MPIPMNSTESIVCKPTPWFLLRALVMLLMFGVFTVLFYIDGTTGYRKKNEVFYLNKAFQSANEAFSKMNAGGALTPDAWTAFASKQEVSIPADRSIMPVNLTLPMPWPAVLHDFERMKSLEWNILWREYTRERGLNAAPPEHPYDAGKMREQMIVCVICAVLSGTAGFFLVRTLRRSISVDGQAIVAQDGRRVLFADLKKLDLRKWDTKGIAFLYYEGASGEGKIRVDGLTYGGFAQKDGEPAERLMRQIRANFSGEIIEYAAAEVTPAEETPPAA